MGMFDYVRSSYPFGEHFTEVCHTKELEYDDIGGTMSHYWISPSGCLYHIDYSNTADFVEIPEEELGAPDVVVRQLIEVDIQHRHQHHRPRPVMLIEFEQGPLGSGTL